MNNFTKLFLLGLIGASSWAQNVRAVQTEQPEQTEQTKVIDASQQSLEEINALKLLVESTYKAELEGCYQKFAVNDCKHTASQKRIIELSRLRAIEVKINAQERALKAEQQKKEYELKALEREQSQKEKTENANIDYQNRIKVNQEKNDQRKANFGTTDSTSNPSPSKSARDPISTPSTEARSQYDAKQQEALKHKQEVQQRLEAKEREKGKPNTP